MTSVSAIVMECYDNRQTGKDYFTTKCIAVAAIFKDFVSGIIPVAVDKINKMAECGSPRLEVNEVCFAGFLQQQLHYKVNNYLLTQNKSIYHAQNVNR